MEMNEITSVPLDLNGNSVQENAKSSAHPETPNNTFCIEKITCYQLKNYLFVVGSSNCQSKHRVLKFDRRCQKDNLLLDGEQRVLSSKELREYRSEEGFTENSRDIESKVTAFGIVGMVRFLEGYYLILIVKRRCMAIIGRHCVYRIEDTVMLYLPNQRPSNSQEERYKSIFSTMDMRSNFYYSYSYDLSNTLQCNLTTFNPSPSDYLRFYGHGSRKTIWDVSADFLASCEVKPQDDKWITINPRLKFVWNQHLLSPMANVHSDFFLYICHGFVSQAFLPISGPNLAITLIARRSKQYAGTRYLKRGANCQGFPANEVETEQIVHDVNIASFKFGRFSSFVQMRGSVPTYWSQNISPKITKLKPPITIDLKDPFYVAAGKHFNNLLFDYGSPVIVLNLVKQKEKRPQESILYGEFESAIEYLNQFLPPVHRLLHIDFDMARTNKMKDQNVISHLSAIALFTLKKTGFFLNRHSAINKVDSQSAPPLVQTGIIRVNCVDCLDRTNTAQFAIGRIALSHQLFALGAIARPELPFDTDIVRLLEMLYEDHGDTLALQYGGSQLVHRIKSYRKIAPLTAQSKDKMQSLSRYYSNTFSDTDKQMAMNLFLGIYPQLRNSEPIWSLKCDYALHHNFNREFKSICEKPLINRSGYTKWWQDEVAKCLPRAARQFYPDKSSIFGKRFTDYDWFGALHRLNDCATLTELFLYVMHEKLSDFAFIKATGRFAATNKKRISLMQIGLPPNEEDSDDSDDSETTSVAIRDCQEVRWSIPPSISNNIVVNEELECKTYQPQTTVDQQNDQYKLNSTLPTANSTLRLYLNWMDPGNFNFLKPSCRQNIHSTYESLISPNSIKRDKRRVYTEYLQGTTHITTAL